MKNKSFLLIITILLFVISNFCYFFIYGQFDVYFFVSIIFSNFALVYSWLLNSKFSKNQKLNKVISIILAHIYFIVSTIITIISLVNRWEYLYIVPVQGVLLIVSCSILFYFITTSRSSSRLYKFDRENNINQKALEIDLLSLKCNDPEVDELIYKVIDILKYSPKNANQATIEIDKKITATASVLQDKTISKDDKLTALNFLIDLINEKNKVLNLTN